MADENKEIVHRCDPGVRLLCVILLAIILLAGVVTLVFYLIYRPSKPDFTVVGANVFRLSNSSTRPNVLSTSMQFTLVSHNPSERSSILYDNLSAPPTSPIATSPSLRPPTYPRCSSTVPPPSPYRQCSAGTSCPSQTTSSPPCSPTRPTASSTYGWY